MQVNENTVTIKKAPRSTFDHYHTHKGSGRIGDLNVVWRKMLMPSDMIRCRVSSSIQFISPLSVPAFARMKVYTYYFFEPYQNVQSDFNDVIMNYQHEVKTELENGTLVNKSNYYTSYINSIALSNYMLSLYYDDYHDVHTYHSPDDVAFRALLRDSFPDKLSWIFPTLNARNNIFRLLNQMGLPVSLILPSDPSSFNDVDLPDYITTENNISDSDQRDAFYKLQPQFNYYKSFANYAGDYPVIYITASPNGRGFSISALPFKCYQSIYNDWFNNSMTNSEIDIYRDTVNCSPLNTQFLLEDIPYEFVKVSESQVSQDNLGVNFNQSYLRTFDYMANFMMNSIFSIRQPWYAKDYFNTASADPTLGVSPYSVGSSILDLRKNSALQRLAEKKALCGNKLVDFIVQHFNIYPPDLEIGRSIHLGTSVNYVTVSEVLQTSQTTDSSPQGERAAIARSNGTSKGVFFKAPTYGDFQVLQCIKPEIDYFNGVPKELTITDAADYPLPELAQIGMDTILKRELSINALNNYDYNAAFGYCPRYSFHKMSLNQVSGRLAYDLEFWHQSPDLRLTRANLDYNFGRIGFDVDVNHGFASRKSSDQFPLTDSPAYNRIFAVTDLNEDTYVYMHEIYATINTPFPSNDMPQL